MSKDKGFSDWMDELNEAVIQDEYGYEDGEFVAYPELWEPLYREGLTPSQAFKRALDDFGGERRKRDAEAAENWARIQEADRLLTPPH